MNTEKIKNASPLLAVVIYILAFVAIIVITAAVVWVIVNNPGSTLKIILAIVIGLIIVAGIILLLKVFIGIRYVVKGPQTQTDMSYDINDQEHAESFSEAKDAPSERK